MIGATRLLYGVAILAVMALGVMTVVGVGGSAARADAVGSATMSGQAGSVLSGGDPSSVTTDFHGEPDEDPVADAILDSIMVALRDEQIPLFRMSISRGYELIEIGVPLTLSDEELTRAQEVVDLLSEGLNVVVVREDFSLPCLYVYPSPDDRCLGAT